MTNPDQGKAVQVFQGTREERIAYVKLHYPLIYKPISMTAGEREFKKMMDDMRADLGVPREPVIGEISELRGRR